MLPRRRRSGRAVGESSPSYVAARGPPRRPLRGLAVARLVVRSAAARAAPPGRRLARALLGLSESPRCRYDGGLGSAAAGAAARGRGSPGAASIPSSQRGSGDRRQSSARRWYDCSRRRSSSWRSKSRRRAAGGVAPPRDGGLLALVLEALVLLAGAPPLLRVRGAAPRARRASRDLALVRRVLLPSPPLGRRALLRPKPPRPRPQPLELAPPRRQLLAPLLGFAVPAPRPRGGATPGRLAAFLSSFSASCARRPPPALELPTPLAGLGRFRGGLLDQPFFLPRVASASLNDACRLSSSSRYVAPRARRSSSRLLDRLAGPRTRFFASSARPRFFDPRLVTRRSLSSTSASFATST